MPSPPVERLDQLRYCLYRQLLHPEVVPVQAQRVLESRGLRLRFALLADGGHLLELTGRGPGPRQVLVELLAPTELDLPPGGRVEELSLAGRDLPVSERGWGDYECAWEVDRPGLGRSAAALLRLRQQPAPPGWERLRVDRSHPENDAPGPFTLLDVQLAPGGFEACAAYAFPAERAFLFLRTRFTLPC